MKTTPSFFDSSNPLQGALTRVLPVGLVALALGGCVFESPYWAQTFDSTGSQIPIQTWTTDKTRNVKIECSKAYHGGLQPPFGPEEWHLVTNLTPSVNPSYDTAGAAIYSAGTKIALPSVCWHADGAYSPPKHMTALRATQLTASGGTTVYRVFDLAGLECLGRENGKGGSWFSWLSKHCAKTYSDGSTPIPWVRVIANAAGASAMAVRALPKAMAAAPAAAAQTSSEDLVASLDRAFQGEPVDPKWGASQAARLRAAFEAARPSGSVLVDSACRSTLCRVEVTHADIAAQERFVGALAPLGLFSNDGASGAAQHSGGKSGMRSVYFMAREGRDLVEAAAGR
jgi:hypothetical protein